MTYIHNYDGLSSIILPMRIFRKLAILYSIQNVEIRRFLYLFKDCFSRQIASLQKLERDTIDNHATLIENYGFLRKVHWFTFVVGSLKNVAIPARTLFLTPRTVPEIKREVFSNWSLGISWACKKSSQHR